MPRKPLSIGGFLQFVPLAAQGGAWCRGTPQIFFRLASCDAREAPVPANRRTNARRRGRTRGLPSIIRGSSRMKQVWQGGSADWAAIPSTLSTRPARPASHCAARCARRGSMHWSSPHHAFRVARRQSRRATGSMRRSLRFTSRGNCCGLWPSRPSVRIETPEEHCSSQ